MLLLPTAAVSRAWGAIVRWKRPRFFVRLLMRVFVRFAGIDLTDAAEPFDAFENLEALFVRRLRDGARPIVHAPDAVVSPVDAVIGELGTVTEGTLLQVKGRPYSLAELLDDEDAAKAMEGGAYLTLYLAPHDYHRIHAPVAGHVVEAVALRGRLLPVFPAAIASIDGIFARNERLVTYLEHATGGRLAVVNVGATLVGRMSVTYDATLRTNARTRPQALRRRYEPAIPLARGAELGAFELGSTVVLVAERGLASFDAVASGQAVRMGERIGRLTEERPGG